MLSFLFVSLYLAATPQGKPIEQRSSGWCSPNIANVTGNVTVNCIGVDPRALRRLNAELNRRNLDLAEKIHEADNWARRYHELEADLRQSGTQDAMSRQAAAYLEAGELDKAEETLKKAAQSGEKEIDKVARKDYAIGLLEEMKFQPQEALPYLEKAYQYRPEQAEYGLTYSEALQQENDFSRAEPVLLATLETTRRMAKADPASYQSYVATVENNLGNLYRDTKRMKEAQDALAESLEIRRELAKTNPATYQPDVAEALNNLAIVYRDSQQIKKAGNAFREALDIRRQLAKTNPDTYEPEVALSLNNLGIFYSETGRMKQAEDAYTEALNTYRQLAKKNPAAYQSYVAYVQNGLGGLYHDTDRMQEAENSYKEALDIWRPLSEANPSAYEPQLARTLKNLAVLYRDTHRTREAEGTYQESLDIRRGLAKGNAAANQPDVASTLNSLAILELDENKVTQARAYVDEALTINRDLWKADPTLMGDSLARSLLIKLDVLTKAQEPTSARCPLAQEAGTVAYSSELKKIAAQAQSELCNAP